MKFTLSEEMGLLKNVSLFADIKSEDLKVIALTTHNIIFEAGEVIVNEGDEGHEAYIIYSGQVEVYRKSASGEPMRLNLLDPGEMFGELALFGDGFRTASVKALEETYLAVISKEKLYEIIREFPDIAIEMLKVLTRRFTKAENRLLGIIRKQ